MIPIVTAPNTILTTPAREVKRFDKHLSKLIKDMSEALLATKNPKGVGLAAPQIGEPWRLFITKPTDRAKIRVFVNPVISWKSLDVSDTIEDDDKKLEGCLSIPRVWGNVTRAKVATVSFQDIKGNKHEETFTGLMAVIVQHETDHLSGTLFSQRVMEQKGKFYTTVKDKDGKEILEEITI